MEIAHLSLFMMLCLGIHSSSSEILHRQKRDWIIESFIIDEGYDGEFPYVLGKIPIREGLPFSDIEGPGVDEEPIGTLQLNKETKELIVHRPVDYEQFQDFMAIFYTVAEDTQKYTRKLGLAIDVIDANDNAPRFDLERYEVSIKESTVQGTTIITVRATDADATEKNSKFSFKIVSVTPAHDLEFHINQTHGAQTGDISFKGCLNHEKAERYTIIVEAKDEGEKIQLSSSCTVIISIEDGNNHLPEITGQTGPGRVKEGEANVLVSRLQVTDKDTKGTVAWRAIYQIQGDTNHNFRITTDPETNEGLLYVEKQLDYEDCPLKNVTISVDNGIPYHSCTVVSRRATGLWEVKTTEEYAAVTRTVTVTVEDVNEAPVFDKSNEQVSLSENVEAGWHLATFTARDPDFGRGNTFVYIKGEDPADWVTVDAVTGKITTSKSLDRESQFVRNNIYIVRIYAVDNGKPQMSGTATLSIHIRDENDHAPTLNVSTIHMCQSAGPSLGSITAMDLDEEPYGGPFNFKLLGDVEREWRVETRQGYSANLVKENTVPSGEFTLLLEVSDRQHVSAVHNLSVIVCSCSPARSNCSRPVSSSAPGGGAVGIIFFSLLLLAGLMLLASLVSCKKQNLPMPDEGSGHLIPSNTETPGNDCKVPFRPTKIPEVTKIPTTAQVPTTWKGVPFRPTKIPEVTKIPTTAQVPTTWKGVPFRPTKIPEVTQIPTTVQVPTTWKGIATVSGASQTQHQWNKITEGFKPGNSLPWGWTSGSKYSTEHEIGVHREILFNALGQMQCNLEAPGEELCDYAPRVYATDADTESGHELDAISILDIPFDPDCDLDLKFSTLASICMPHESTADCAETSSVMQQLETMTWKAKKLT